MYYVFRTEEVAGALIKLCEDEQLNGEALLVNKTNGYQFTQFTDYPRVWAGLGFELSLNTSRGSS